MHKFKVGDTVKITDDTVTPSHLGMTAEIIGFRGSKRSLCDRTIKIRIMFGVVAMDVNYAPHELTKI